MGEYSLFYLFLIGLALMLFGAYLNILARKELARSWSPLSSSDNSEKLIKSGIYAHIRHPIYLSNLIFFSGVTLVAGNWYEKRKKNSTKNLAKSIGHTQKKLL
jgi:protein-S-isoprenylcysteine O-methyltransferase Ste14